jgi:hypothetical protein
MWMEACLSFRSYIPRKLEEGMLFLGNDNGTPYIFKLEKVPLNQEAYIQEMGYPVEPYIVDIGDPNKDEVEEVVAEPHQIGWWDEGEEFEDLFSVDVRHFNNILLDYDGWVDIAMEDDEEGNIFPSLINGKITLRYVVNEEEDEWIPNAEF